MREELKHEVQQLKEIFASYGVKLCETPGASEEEIQEVETRLGFHLDPDLRDLYRYSNGSKWHFWFLVISDEPTPCDFLSLQQALRQYNLNQPFDEKFYQEWADRSVDRDPRIKPYLRPRQWYPLAQFNGCSTVVYFDTGSADTGGYGQIIVYQHDPDGVYYVAENFLEFFRLSNRLLPEHLAQDDELRSIFLKSRSVIIFDAESP